jgi:hypothetical protein
LTDKQPFFNPIFYRYLTVVDVTWQEVLKIKRQGNLLYRCSGWKGGLRDNRKERHGTQRAAKNVFLKKTRLFHFANALRLFAISLRLTFFLRVSLLSGYSSLLVIALLQVSNWSD